MNLLEIITKLEEKQNQEISWNLEKLAKDENQKGDCSCQDCDPFAEEHNDECYNIDFWFYTNQLEEKTKFYKAAISFIKNDLLDETNEINFTLNFSNMSNSIYLEFLNEENEEQTIRISDHNRKSYEQNGGGWADHYYFLEKIIK